MNNIKNLSIVKKEIKIAILGTLVGVINGLVGGFAGIVSIIILKKVFFLSQKNAQATTLAYIWVLALISSIIYMNNDVRVRYIDTLWLILGGILGTFLGTLLLKKLKNETLNNIFAIIVIATGIVVILC